MGELHGQPYELEHVHDIEKLDEKIKISGEYFIDCKIEGIDVKLKYKLGKLYEAIAIISNGTTVDITNNIRDILDIPKFIPLIVNIEEIIVQGIVYISYNNFCKLFRDKNQKTFREKSEIKNQISRNVVDTTIINLLTSTDSIKENNMLLSAYMHDIIDAEKYKLKTQEQVINELNNYGFTTQGTHIITGNTERIKRYIEQILKTKKTFNFNVEGVMIKSNNISEKMGIIYNFGITEDANDYLNKIIRKLALELTYNNQLQEHNIAKDFDKKTVVILGEFLKYSKEEIQLIVEKLGADTTNNINKFTDIVIVGRNVDIGVKLAKANKLGLRIIDEDRLYSLIQGAV